MKTINKLILTASLILITLSTQVLNADPTLPTNPGTNPAGTDVVGGVPLDGGIIEIIAAAMAVAGISKLKKKRDDRS